MKKFKNTFGVTGSTHAINHFAELAVKEGWKEQLDGIREEGLYFNGNSEVGKESLQKQHFWNIRPFIIGKDSINISTPEGWNKALDLMKEVEEEQLYGECLASTDGFTKGKIYKITKINQYSYNVELDDNGSNENGWVKHNFKLVPESAYLEQEAKKEKIKPFKNHMTIEEALAWNKRMFGEKEDEIQTLPYNKRLELLTPNGKEISEILSVEERLTSLELKYNTITLIFDVLGEEIKKLKIR
jgi:hypothetical protein